MNSIKAHSDSPLFPLPSKNNSVNSPDQKHKSNNFMSLFKPLIQISNIALNISAKCKPSAVALTHCFSALVFFSMPLAEARNLPRDKKSKEDDYKTIGKKLYQASLQRQDENNIHPQKTSDEKLRIKNMPQAVTAGLYYASALTSLAEQSQKRGSWQDNRIADDAYSAALPSSALAMRTKRNAEQFPVLDPNQHYMILREDDNADRWVPLENIDKNSHHNFLIYKDDIGVLTRGFPPSAVPADTPRDASRIARPGRRGPHKKRLEQAVPNRGKHHNSPAKVKNAKFRDIAIFSKLPNGPGRQDAIIQQCKAILAVDEYGIAAENLNPAYYGQGKVYEVFNGRDGASQPVSRFYVLINAERISVRPVVMPEHSVKYEIFDAGNQTVGYPLAFNSGQWKLQQPTAQQASKSFIRRITPAMVDQTIAESALSAPDKRGLQWTHDHKSYLRIKGHFVELIRDKNKINKYHIKTKYNRNSINVKFHNNKFIITPQRSGAKGNVIAERREIITY